MKYALVNGEKTEARRGETGYCPSCGQELIAKCGNTRIEHWAHKGILNCDPWWENETLWHRSWKAKFPVDWQEIVHFDQKGEKHIADIKTDSGWILEFQHSFITMEEHIARNNFYQKIVWIVDGGRRKTDYIQFNKMLQQSRCINSEKQIFEINYIDEYRLLYEWKDKKVSTIIDFTDLPEANNDLLWLLLPIVKSNTMYYLPILKSLFIELQINNLYCELIDKTLMPEITNMRDSGYSNLVLNNFLNRNMRRSRRRIF